MDSTGVVGKIQVSMMIIIIMIIMIITIIMLEGTCHDEDGGMVDKKLLKPDGVFQGDPRH